MRIAIEPGVRLFVDIEGLGLVPDGGTLREKPTVLLLHGGPGGDHSSFKPSLSPLSDVAQLVYYDHRGHRRSDRRSADEWTLDVWADDVVRLCDALGIVKPIVLGQSFGGTVAQHYLARHPDHPAKVVLSSTSANLGLARKLALFERLGGPAARDAAERFWSDPTAESLGPYLEICMPLYNRTSSAAERNRGLQFDVELLTLWSGKPLQALDLLPGLARARCPVLVIGGEDDPVTPVDDQRDIARALPPGLVDFHVFARAGHGVWRDRPADGLALLKAFVAGEPTTTGTTPRTTPASPIEHVHG